MSKFANTARIILLLVALVGVIRLMRYLETQGASNSSFFQILLGEPQMPKPPTHNNELPTPASEIPMKDDNVTSKSNESR
jgi:hypothetical protein